MVYFACSDLTAVSTATTEVNKVLDRQDSLHWDQRRKGGVVDRPTLEDGESANWVPVGGGAERQPQYPKHHGSTPVRLESVDHFGVAVPGYNHKGRGAFVYLPTTDEYRQPRPWRVVLLGEPTTHGGPQYRLTGPGVRCSQLTGL